MPPCSELLTVELKTGFTKVLELAPLHKVPVVAVAVVDAAAILLDALLAARLGGRMGTLDDERVNGGGAVLVVVVVAPPFPEVRARSEANDATGFDVVVEVVGIAAGVVVVVAAAADVVVVVGVDAVVGVVMGGAAVEDVVGGW